MVHDERASEMVALKGVPICPTMRKLVWAFMLGVLPGRVVSVEPKPPHEAISRPHRRAAKARRGMDLALRYIACGSIRVIKSSRSSLGRSRRPHLNPVHCKCSGTALA